MSIISAFETLNITDSNNSEDVEDVDMTTTDGTVCETLHTTDGNDYRMTLHTANGNECKMTLHTTDGNDYRIYRIGGGIYDEDYDNNESYDSKESYDEGCNYDEVCDCGEDCICCEYYDNLRYDYMYYGTQ